MKGKMSKLVTLAIVGTAGAFALTGCGSNSSTTTTENGNTAENAPIAEKSYTYVVTSKPETSEYDEYEDNPSVKYWLDRSFDVDGQETRVSIDFSALPAGSEEDNLNTLFATGEYADVMAVDMAVQSVEQLYEDGIARDITEYVEKYMPNYLAWSEEHPEYLLTNNIDGEQRYICLYSVADAPSDPWCGYMYRRDWVVKYGKNPETDEEFTGGWNEDKTEWTDDVVFPSGNTDPMTLTDWNWLLDIFQTALEGEGITDGYATQLAYCGYAQTGEVNSSFGGHGMLTYINDEGRAEDGLPTDCTREYIRLMADWYEKGWIDQAFEERTDVAVFWEIDMGSIYSGKVGMWCGTAGQLGSTMEGDSELTSDICVYAAALPINDAYGDESMQNAEPGCFLSSGLTSSSIIITDHVKDEDLPALLTALDYNYSYEGGLLHTYGLSHDMVSEVSDEVYSAYGLTGSYDLVDDTVVVDTAYNNNPDVSGLHVFNSDRVVGLSVYDNVNWGYTPVYSHCMEQWRTYDAKNNVPGTLSGQIKAAESEELSTIKASLFPYIVQEVPNFITGRRDVNDDDEWQDFCDQVNELGSGREAEVLNSILGAE